MTSGSLKSLEEIFAQAVELDGAARDAFVRTLRDDDPNLAAEVERLLAADAGADSVFDAPIASAFKAFMDAPADPWIGRRFGPWTIMSRIGAGGMGHVFKAERVDEHFAQTVALKVMAGQLLGSQAMTRFRAERQILADLNHPRIASLIDGGSTDEGLPYLVMEYVDGERLDAYCDAHALSVPDRLALFMKICEAVDYAHRRLVVHRDLKPGNILVGANGEPKLLDFGIAKLLEPEAYEMTLAETGGGARLMTPEYASPEQVRGEPVSIATDVYALGVLLFELLTGRSPYDAPSTNRRDLESAILEAAPKRPSGAVTGAYSSGRDGAGPSSAEIGASRAASPEKLRRMLTGDLDNIVLKCLQKDPERRYPTARELSDDIERHLNQQPVHARGDHWTYTTGKFLKRRARAVAATAAVAATLAGLTIFYTARLAEERDRSTLAARQAEEVASFLSDLFESASPLVTQGETVTAIDLLDDGLARAAELGDQPELQAELYLVIGKSYSQLGQLERGLEILQEPVRLLEALPNPDPLALADALVELAEAQRRLGMHNESIAGWLRVLELRRAALGEENSEVAFTLARVGAALGAQGRSLDALEYLERALAIKEALGEEDADLLDIRGVTQVNLAQTGQFTRAVEVGRSLIDSSRRQLGELHPNTFLRIGNTGIHLHQDYRTAEGLPLLNESIALEERVYPPDHPDIAYAKRYRAGMYRRLGRFEEAAADLEAAAAITRAGGREGTMEWASYLNAVGSMQLDLLDPEAGETFAECIRFATELGGPDAVAVVRAEMGLAIAEARAGRLAEGEARMRRALAHEGRYQASVEWYAKRHLALMLAEQGRFEEGAAMLDAIIAALEAMPEGLNGPAIEVLIDRATHRRLAGDLEGAEADARRARALGEDRLPEGNWILALADAEIGKSLLAQRRADEAVRYLRSARSALLATFGADDRRVAALDALIEEG